MKAADDHTSVDAWVEQLNEMGEDSPVLIYKPQGAQPTEETPGLSASDFILALQTVTQRQLMMKFGNGNVVCLDSTHGTNQYDFNLVTVMVVDDFGEGSPVAFLICNREDEPALGTFFTAVKQHLPDAEYRASHVMTDDAGQYYNAWVAVFGPAEKKLCTWHIDRSWRKAIKGNISCPDKQVEIYHMLRTLLQELNEEEFRRYLEAFMEYVQTETPRFAEYFAPYCGRAKEWAYCYRIGIQANTNMYVESFHNVLKTAYMQRKANRRIDSLITILLKIARDKAFEQLIKVEKNSSSKKIQEIKKRHVMVLRHLPMVTDGGWMVPSESRQDQHYFVVAADKDCTCSMRCSHCHCCPHMYSCSCIDFAVHATVCKHVHTIHSLQSRTVAESGQLHLAPSIWWQMNRKTMMPWTQLQCLHQPMRRQLPVTIFEGSCYRRRSSS